MDKGSTPESSFMMEDSEKRRERLKAMRAAADQADDSGSVVQSSSSSGLLNNPLLETPNNLRDRDSLVTSRFDFYTDPMAPFSANYKKRDAAATTHSGSSTPRMSSSPRAGPRNPEMIPPPAHQMQSNYPPYQRPFHAQVPYQGVAPTPYRSPRGFANPFPLNQGTPPDVWRAASGASAPYGYGPPGVTGPYPMHHGNPNLRPVGIPSFIGGQGRPPWPGNNPGGGSGGSFASGRGQGQWHRENMSPGFGQRGGRRWGSPSFGSARDETLVPGSLYHPSMVEDPWQQLEPVMWRAIAPASNVHTRESSNSCLPKSVMKRPRVFEPSNTASSRQSLAEYLAASINEAVEDAPSA